jgi:hypothetical protein
MRLFLALLILAALTGCSGDWIRASAIEPAVVLVSREYETDVRDDSTLSGSHRDAKLQTARMLRDLVQRAAKGGNDAWN